MLVQLDCGADPVGDNEAGRAAGGVGSRGALAGVQHLAGVDGPVMESAGAVGLVLGVVLAGAELRWLAIALTAAVALLAGALARRRAPHLSSWLAFGPGLAVALLPSLGLAVDQGGAARPLLLTAGALLVVLAGARARLQAPLVLGALTLVALGVNAVWPVAAQLPRWATIGAAGLLLLLWLGATAERRLAQLRELRRRLQDLEHDGIADAPR
ncbi:MAG TPA: hypothetical protein VFA46_17700 [Actinomycetes bacterium]|nr:hypothetical protein [Actinomycetes bacterium]